MGMRGEYIANADAKLAGLLTTHLGTEVSVEQVKALIDGHWSKFSALAHAVHDRVQADRRQNEELLAAWEHGGPASVAQ